MEKIIGIDKIIEHFISTQTKNNIILGLNGSGKTTTAQKIATKTNAITFFAHDFENAAVINKKLVLKRAITQDRKRYEKWYEPVKVAWTKIEHSTNEKINSSIKSKPNLLAKEVVTRLDSISFKSNSLTMLPLLSIEECVGARQSLSKIFSLYTPESIETIKIPPINIATQLENKKTSCHLFRNLNEFRKIVIKQQQQSFEDFTKCPLCFNDVTSHKFIEDIKKGMNEYSNLEDSLKKLSDDNKKWDLLVNKIQNSNLNNISDLVKRSIGLEKSDIDLLYSKNPMDVKKGLASILLTNALGRVKLYIEALVENEWQIILQYKDQMTEYIEWYENTLNHQLRDIKDPVLKTFKKILSKYKIIKQEDFDIKLNEDNKSLVIEVRDAREKEITKFLSFGEQKIIEFIFTLVLLETESQDEITLILDDPIDSNDDYHSIITIGEIANILKNNNHKTIVLTHNKLFVSETLKSYAEIFKSNLSQQEINLFLLSNPEQKSTSLELIEQKLESILNPWEKLWGYYDNKTSFSNTKYNLSQKIVWSIISREYFRVAKKMTQNYDAVSDCFKWQYKYITEILIKNKPKYNKDKYIYNFKKYVESLKLENIEPNEFENLISKLENSESPKTELMIILKAAVKDNLWEKGFLEATILRNKINSLIEDEKIENPKLKEYRDVLDNIIHWNPLAQLAPASEKLIKGIQEYLKNLKQD